MVNTSSFVFYIIIAVKIKQDNDASSSLRNQTSSIRLADIRLTIYGFIMFLLGFLYSIFTFYMATTQEGHRLDQAFLIWMALSDIYSWSNPWFVIIFSKHTRRYIYKLIACKSHQNVHKRRATEETKRGSQSIIRKFNNLPADVGID